MIRERAELIWQRKFMWKRRGKEIGKDGAAHYKIRYWMCIFWPARDCPEMD